MSSRWGRLEQVGQRAQTGGGIGSRASKGGIGEHGFDGLNSGDRFFGERETEGDGAQQLSIDIHRAAAHALQNSGFGKRATAETGDNDGLFGAEILENAEDFDLELFNTVSLEDGPAYAMQSGVDILEWEKLLSVCELD